MAVRYLVGVVKWADGCMKYGEGTTAGNFRKSTGCHFTITVGSWQGSLTYPACHSKFYGAEAVSTSPPDIISTMMIVWRIREKVIRT